MTTTETLDRVPAKLHWREAEHALTPDIDALAAKIPPMCGKAGTAGAFRDLNRDWECTRSHHIDYLFGRIQWMRGEAARREHHLRNGKTFYAANLNACLIYDAGHIEFLLRHWNLAVLPCTHAEPHEYADHRDALPDCGC